MTWKDIQLLLRAMKFSADKHRNQRRKDREASPYINHPIQVAETLAGIGNVRNKDTLIAAILHDTLEDTDTHPDEIKRLFGKTVLSLVQEVTDDKNLPKKERKELQVKHAPHKSIEAKKIKLADKISNIRDITNSPPANWSLKKRREYIDWSERVVAGLRGANKKLEKFYDDSLAAARQKLKTEEHS